MCALAAVMTGKGISAIATILVFGDQAIPLVTGLVPDRPMDLSPGQIRVGTIVDADQPVDQVAIGCEGKDLLAIHCHGNPLIVEQIMALLQRSGARLVTPEAIRVHILRHEGADAITIEARLALSKTRTWAGTQLVANQLTTGLRPTILRWRTTDLDSLRRECRRILAASPIGRWVICGCTIAIVGPPNSGKSTLLNWLARRDLAVVSPVRGTTRDWVGAECQMGLIQVTLIDTAGLDERLDADVDRTAQDRTFQMIERADLVLLILDASQPPDQVHRLPLDRLRTRPMLTVLNKSDLQTSVDWGQWPATLGQRVSVSAKCRVGREALAEAICRQCGVTELSMETPVAFTERQHLLIEQLALVDAPHEALALCSDLLHGPVEG